ncbi:substrate-binding domain-containing protein [Mycobacterium sp. 155]|uniref:substrate-binding domain-containing protein n=1 Tax=Mycobacterium sp. 155 TaxID=1157943 RepID=UPI0009DAC534
MKRVHADQNCARAERADQCGAQPHAAELAYLGFGDFPLADIITPTVTVIDQNPTELGHQATQRILDRIQHPDRRYRRRNVLSVDLVERQSSLAPTRRRDN